MFDVRRCSLAAAGARSWVALAVLLMSGVAAQVAAAQTMAVPAYFYPGSYWTQLDQARSGVGVAVMNPDSGPGAGQNPNYVGAVQSAEAAGINVVGYVYTSYGSRSIAAVESDISNYYSWYPDLDGIFLDEASTQLRQRALLRGTRRLRQEQGRSWTDGSQSGNSDQSVL